MAKPVVVSDKSFESEVIKSSQPVLVDFWAEWCGPCKKIGPLLEEIAVEKQAELKIAKLNVDENPQAGEKYGVMSIPTLLLFKNGKEVARLVGFKPKERLVREIDDALRVAV